MISAKLISSLEKCFLDDHIDQFEELRSISMLKNEQLHLQFLYTSDTAAIPPAKYALQIDGPLAPCITAYNVGVVPVTLPFFQAEAPDDNYLRTTPGLYPDILLPMHYQNQLPMPKGQLRSVWLEIASADCIPAGTYLLTVSLLSQNGEIAASAHTQITVIDACLPKQEMLMTQWLHCDALANYYGCEVWSEKHWALIERFAKTAVRNGMNMILTPVHTPPLDTEVGGERLTTQLVDVTVEQGDYHFDFAKLDRWIEMCDRIGIQYFEIAHFFSQWGVKCAPKIMATVDGEYKRIFGWETDATSEEYIRYLRTFLVEFLSHMKARGDDRRCFFHISDEPSKAYLENYLAAKNAIADLLEDYVIMDALSNFEFFSEGVVKTPIPASDRIEPFINANVKGLWTYYCCSQGKDVSNRFIAMPLYRTRSIGMQFYKFDICGFLHWGYNFYNNSRSNDLIEPFLENTSDLAFPSGDSFSVYPAQEGYALESIRIRSFYEALQDVQAMKLAEQYYPKATIVEKIEAIFGKELTFSRCATDAATMLKIRQCINQMIQEAIS